MGFLIIIAVPLAFAAYHLAMGKQVTGRTVVGPSHAVAGKDVSVVGIAQPWEQPELSKATNLPVLWSRAHYVSRTSTFSRSNSTGPPKLVGKTRTHFQVVDEQQPQVSIAVDSKRLREVKVRNRKGEGSAASGRVEEKAVYPGDRVWLHGRLQDKGGYLVFGRGAVLHDQPPQTRARKHRTFALLGFAATGVAVVVAVAIQLGG